MFLMKDSRKVTVSQTTTNGWYPATHPCWDVRARPQTQGNQPANRCPYWRYTIIRVLVYLSAMTPYCAINPALAYKLSKDGKSAVMENSDLQAYPILVSNTGTRRTGYALQPTGSHSYCSITTYDTSQYSHTELAANGGVLFRQEMQRIIANRVLPTSTDCNPPNTDITCSVQACLDILRTGKYAYEQQWLINKDGAVTFSYSSKGGAIGPGNPEPVTCTARSSEMKFGQINLGQIASSVPNARAGVIIGCSQPTDVHITVNSGQPLTDLTSGTTIRFSHETTRPGCTTCQIDISGDMVTTPTGVGAYKWSVPVLITYD